MARNLWISDRQDRRFGTDLDPCGMQALTRLAMEMGRAVVYPAPRCNLTWLGGEHNNRLPLEIDMKYRVSHTFTLLAHVLMLNAHMMQRQCIPYARKGQGFNNLRCMLGGYLMYGCVAVRW